MQKKDQNPRRSTDDCGWEETSRRLWGNSTAWPYGMDEPLSPRFQKVPAQAAECFPRSLYDLASNARLGITKGTLEHQNGPWLGCGLGMGLSFATDFSNCSTSIQNHSRPMTRAKWMSQLLNDGRYDEDEIYDRSSC